jgi:uncharacterized protein (TIGR03083 family)
MTLIDEQVAAYEASRGRIRELTVHLDDNALGTVVPCCPLWSVKDLVGHLTGVLEDRAAGRMPSAGFAEWTQAQVDRHRGESIGTVLDTWDALTLERTDAPPSPAGMSFDVVTHEHDLCHALWIPGDRASDSVRVGAQRAEERLSAMLTAAEAPGVSLTTEDGTRLVPGGDDPIALTTTRYELMRLVTGRVSRAQAMDLAWDRDASRVLDALFADGFFVLQPVDVIEAERP